MNSKVLYEKAKINRIDRELIKNNINFVEKAKNHSNTIVSNLFNQQLPNLDALKYKPINYYNILKDDNRLHENELLLIFNKNKFVPNQNIYVEAQNSYDF